MISRRFVVMVVIVTMGMTAVARASEPFIAVIATGDIVVSDIPGQSVWTPVAAPRRWNRIGFSWVDVDYRPTAFGSLFLLDSEYTGEPQNLSATTPGFRGSATATPNGDQYIFDAGLTLFPSRNYWFYTNSPPSAPIRLSTQDVHANGITFSASSPFTRRPNEDFAFFLTGTIVPEPATLTMIGMLAAIALQAARRRRRG